jgi:CubicO group peptidase (beta-lactamase class C family)
MIPFAQWPVLPPFYWPTATWWPAAPSVCGIPDQPVADALAYAGSHLPDLHGIVVVCNGFIIAERYYPGSDRTHIHRLHSLTSVVSAALVGSLLLLPRRVSLSEPIGTLVPRVPLLYHGLTLRQLLTMTSGVGWAADSRYGVLDLQWQTHEDWLAHAYLPTTLRPSQEASFQYAAPVTQLLATVIEGVTQDDVQRWAERILFEPLGIHNWVWERDVYGKPLMQVGLSLTARDVAKIGYLYLCRGWWDGQRVFPAAYAVAASQHYRMGGWPCYLPYSYGWWVKDIAPHRALFAVGSGAQYLYLLPVHDIVIVLTGKDQHPESPTSQQQRWIEEMLLPALLDR